MLFVDRHCSHNCFSDHIEQGDRTHHNPCSAALLCTALFPLEEIFSSRGHLCVPLQHFTSDSVQALACVKYLSTLAVSLADSMFRASPQKPSDHGKAEHTSRHTMQKQLILVMGCIDVLAYAAFCTGFAYCGGAVATLALAGGGQIFTALLSKYILKKQLSQGQVIGVRCLTCQLQQHIVPAYVDQSQVCPYAH